MHDDVLVMNKKFHSKLAYPTSSSIFTLSARVNYLNVTCHLNVCTVYVPQVNLFFTPKSQPLECTTEMFCSVHWHCFSLSARMFEEESTHPVDSAGINQMDSKDCPKIIRFCCIFLLSIFMPLILSH